MVREAANAALRLRQPALPRERSLARARSEQSLARFDRIALVLSGGGGLGAYQAGAYTALERSGVRPNWIAGTAVGAINAAIIAGNPPHERVSRLHRFWQELSRCVSGRDDGWVPRRVRRWLPGSPARRDTAGVAEPISAGEGSLRERPLIEVGQLRELLHAAVDFDRVNSGAVRLVLGAVNLVDRRGSLFRQ